MGGAICSLLRWNAASGCFVEVRYNRCSSPSITSSSHRVQTDSRARNYSLVVSNKTAYMFAIYTSRFIVWWWLVLWSSVHCSLDKTTGIRCDVRRNDEDVGELATTHSVRCGLRTLDARKDAKTQFENTSLAHSVWTLTRKRQSTHLTSIIL